MPIDSKVTNGQFVFPNHIAGTTLAIHDGVFVPSEQEVEDGAWRTVNASGYFVLPGLVQAANAAKASELDLAYQGVTTSVPVLDSRNIDELEAELRDLSNESQLNYVPCWRLPADVTGDDISAAQNQSVRVFDLSNEFDVSVSELDFRNCVLRVSAANTCLTSITDLDDDVTIIAMITGPDELRQMERLQSRTPLFIEVDVETLRRTPEFFENGQITTGIDIVRSASEPAVFPLIPFLTAHIDGDFESIVAEAVRLTAKNPALAYGLTGRKASFELGADADFFVFDPATADAWNRSPWPGRVIFSQARGDILLYNDELHVLPGGAAIEQ